MRLRDAGERLEGRLNVIDQMIFLETGAKAVFFGECLMMANWHNENASPLMAMLPGTLIPEIPWDVADD